jgi:pimeloyl-ACP methyl ester carboxylesterase
VLSATLLLIQILGAPAANGVTLVMEEFMVPAADPGISLYVRNKHPQGVTQFPAEKILLYVHGATYLSETALDLKLNGVSWMDYIAGHGYDVYLVDVRGYGKSTRPPEMDKPAADNEPIVRTETAVRDVGAAVDFILKRSSVSKINLLGWSWGTTIMGWYTTQNNDKVNRLVLYAPASSWHDGTRGGRSSRWSAWSVWRHELRELHEAALRRLSAKEDWA